MAWTGLLYLVILVFSCLLALAVDICRNKKRKIIYVFFIILVLSLFAGFRHYSVGMDSETYAQIVQERGMGNHNIEFGFAFLIKILTSFNPTYTFSFTIVSLLTNFFIIYRLYLFKKNGYSMFFMVMIYVCCFYILTFSGQRQWLAVSITFFATNFLYNTKKIKIFPFILCMLIALSIHTSSILSLLMVAPLVFRKAKSVKGKIIKTIIVVCLPFAAYYGFQIFRDKYFRFFETGSFEFGYMGIVKIVVLLLSIIYVLFGIKKQNIALFEKTNKNLSINELVVIETIGVGLSLLGYIFNNVSRISWYFVIYSSIYYGLFLQKKEKNVLVVFIKVLIILMLVVTFIDFWSNTASKWAPYIFFWEK